MKQWIEAVPGGQKARIRYPNGKTRSKTFPSVREARAWLRRTRTEIDDGTYVPEASGKLLFGDWVDQCVAMSVDLAAGTINRRASDLKNWVLPEFGHRTLGSITQPEIRAWIAAMTKAGCNPGSVKLRYETLSTIFRAAVDAELIRRSPCYRVGLPRYERSEMRLLSLREIVTLSEAIEPRYRALVLLAGTGGLRIGELGALRGKRVDFQRHTVEVAENLILDNGRPELGPLKTNASHRKVPVPRQTLAVLEDHFERFGIGRDDLLFTPSPAASSARISSADDTSMLRPNFQAWLPYGRTTSGTARSPLGSRAAPIPKSCKPKPGTPRSRCPMTAMAISSPTTTIGQPGTSRTSGKRRVDNPTSLRSRSSDDTS